MSLWRYRLRQLLCKHGDLTNKITVSGYGYTEWQVWWCCDCEYFFCKKTRDQQ